MLFVLSCDSRNTLFSEVEASRSGITFSNTLTENDSINPLDIVNVYNGGGVGVGDFNGDGLQDLYFSGNRVSCKLFVNKGGFRFEDVTAVSGTEGKGRWGRGVSVVDINNDGRQDIYLSATLQSTPDQRRNLLYVNQGNNDQQQPIFKEMAAAYGLDDSGHSTHAAFFDYDNDGDLDVYILTNEVNTGDFPDNFHPVMRNGENPSTGRLYRNDWKDSLAHGYFVNVSREAGIQTEGYGHSVNITDFNQDGWKDIYVTNDFISNDLLWINNRNGTFSEQLSVYFKHTSANAMGNDIVDINHDGLDDVIALDMNPEDNYRKKMMLNSNAYQKYQNSDRFGFNYQYVRNTLQLNQGPRVGPQDTIGVPIFSDISYYAGVAETDWSWTPVVNDFDNDGHRDIVITNGFPRDLTDHDFINYRNQATNIASKETILTQIPEVRIPNYAFRNRGNLTFEFVTDTWGLEQPSFSNGAVYADLDNDGDLDIVMNNINSPAGVFKNHTRERFRDSSHYLQVKLVGTARNRNAIGARISLHYEGRSQQWENTPYRGYLSSVDPRIFFGLGKTSKLDSLVVFWPDGKKGRVIHPHADTLLTLDASQAMDAASTTPVLLVTEAWFTDVTPTRGLAFQHAEKDFVDFNIQKLLPHKFSEYGPAIAVGDMDTDGLEDFIVGGGIGNSARLFLQQQDGRFRQRLLTADTGTEKKKSQDMGLLLFDADKDGDLDLYIASGGYVYKSGSPYYQDRFYRNNGKAQFSLDTLALPSNTSSKLCVRAADYDKDGDLDLFLSGRVEPWMYPKPVSCFLYRNDSEKDKPAFTDVTSAVAPDLVKGGLVCDGVFTDFDNDGWQDLVLAGEWMPMRFLKNDRGIFTEVTAQTGLASYTGWWNSIVSGDFDNDGDIDFVAGNLGENTFYKATEHEPVAVYAGDFDKNGSYDVIPSLYLPYSMTDRRKREFPAFGRDDLIKQMISMRSRFQSYSAYASATMDSVLVPELRRQALILKAQYMRSSYIRNDGQGKFSLHALPREAQFSVLNGMIADDFNADGFLDLAITGNDYGTEVATGRYDALNGLVLRGDGKGGFHPLSILESGIFLPGNGKALTRMRDASGHYLVIASEHRGPLKMYQLNVPRAYVKLGDGDVLLTYIDAQGKQIRKEGHFGESFLSQSGRWIAVDPGIKEVTIADGTGVTRKVPVEMHLHSNNEAVAARK
jgi:hypothetical protein